jgi:hypothetical protein
MANSKNVLLRQIFSWASLLHQIVDFYMCVILLGVGLSILPSNIAFAAKGPRVQLPLFKQQQQTTIKNENFCATNDIASDHSGTEITKLYDVNLYGSSFNNKNESISRNQVLQSSNNVVVQKGHVFAPVNQVRGQKISQKTLQKCHVEKLCQKVCQKPLPQFLDEILCKSVCPISCQNILCPLTSVAFVPKMNINGCIALENVCLPLRTHGQMWSPPRIYFRPDFILDIYQ